ncbi:DUF6518 family protein [Paractinoplanes deccanensis]|nr:DUF6518 family protein [Actinoplanes deccanensis]
MASDQTSCGPTPGPRWPLLTSYGSSTCPFLSAGWANSIAVWAVAAFLLAFLGRWTLPVGILGAIVCLVLAVPSYYLAATLIQDDALANMYDATAWIWMGSGVLAGTVFGAAGVLARTGGHLCAAALGEPVLAPARARAAARPSADRSGIRPAVTHGIPLIRGLARMRASATNRFRRSAAAGR